MSKFILSAGLILGSLASLGSTGLASEENGRTTLTQATGSVEENTYRDGPYTAEDAQVRANHIIQLGYRFLRYEQDAAGFWYVVYTR